MWALVDSNNIVINKIVYEPSSNYVPPVGCSLREINSWVDIGMNADIKQADVPLPQPTYVGPDKKTERDAVCKEDLSIIALFDAAKKQNPDLTFSAYLDSLEMLKSNIV